jgi:hypothetical protein
MEDAKHWIDRRSSNEALYSCRWESLVNGLASSILQCSYCTVNADMCRLTGGSVLAPRTGSNLDRLNSIKERLCTVDRA